MTTDEATRIVMTHRLLRRYVLPGERVVLAARWHWAKLLEPALTALAVLALCGWLSFALQPALGESSLLVWWLWLAALARLGWTLLVWRVEWFVATDKRMLLLTGLVTHQIGMMPLMKVTDMRYSRSVLGQLLGYGQFLLESAGQDQALRQINWVARPDATYRDLCALIFTPGQEPPDGRPGTGRPGRAGWPSSPEPLDAAHAHAHEYEYEHGHDEAPSPARPPVVPPALVPTSSGTPAPAADDEAYAPGDTQPILAGPRTQDVPRTDDDEPSWFVSEPTARFVDLGHQQPRRTDGADA